MICFKVEETLSLRESAQHVASAAKQLQPFAACIAAVTSLIDRRRCHQPELAPMESICLQINTIEPNSQHRIEAIQKVGFSLYYYNVMYLICPLFNH